MQLTIPLRFRIPPTLFSLFFFLVALSIASTALAQDENRLEVKGDLVRTLSFTVQELARLPQQDISESRQLDSKSGKETAQVSYQGVLLKDVLAAADMKEGQRHDFRKTLIVARARDGYIALFTWGELFNATAGEHVLVITGKNGKPLAASEGPFALRALGDIKPGPRHVKWLQQIELRLIP